MYNLIKLELLQRKNIIKILGIVLVMAQLYAFYCYYNNDINNGIGSLFIVGFISMIVYTFSSFISFSKDINERERSMVFMVPKTGFSIISSKFITTFILGSLLFLIYIGGFIGNVLIVNPSLIGDFSIEFQNFSIKLAFLTIISFSSFLALVYLSIIITKTFLSRLKFRLIITLVVMSILSKIFNIIIWNNVESADLISSSILLIPVIAITIVMLWISGWLIDNKTDF